MPLPSPYDYDDWKDFASALISSLGDGTADVIASGVGGSSGGSGGVTTAPPGFEFVYWNGDLANLFAGADILTAPPLFSPFQIDTQSLALAAVELNNIADGAVGTTKLMDLSVVNEKIANATILSAKIGDLQVVTAKIDDLAVNSAKIGTLAVNTLNVANAAITQAKIGLLAVGAANIITASIGSAHIVDGSITNADIGSATILAANIGAAQITSALIANATILTADIAAAQITGALIAAATILTANIADAQITNAKIADAEISSAKIIDLVVNKISSGTLNAVIDVGTGILRFTIGGNRLSIGKGFGNANQFVMWFGPDMAENLMTEMTAIFYLKTNGDAYFGGSLIAGTLVNGSTSSGLSGTQTTETGTFGSTGATRVYVASFSYVHHQILTTGGSVAGTDSVDLYIEHWNGISWDILGHTFLSETDYFYDAPVGGTPGSFDHSFGGSVTYTDNSGGLSISNLRARIANRTTITITGSTGPAADIQQRLGIQSVEQ